MKNIWKPKHKVWYQKNDDDKLGAYENAVEAAQHDLEWDEIAPVLPEQYGISKEEAEKIARKAQREWGIGGAKRNEALRKQGRK